MRNANGLGSLRLVTLLALLVSALLVMSGCACSMFGDKDKEEGASNESGEEKGKEEGGEEAEEGGEEEAAEGEEEEEGGEEEAAEEEEEEEVVEEEPDEGNEEDKQDDKSDVALLGEACEGGDGRKCNNLGFRYDRGIGVETDKKKALELYKKACELKDNVGCNNAGIFLEKGEADHVDPAAAASAYVQSCELDNPYGCTNAGRVYWEAKGVSKDEDRALGYYRKGCDGYVPVACNNWAWYRCYDQKNCDEEAEKIARRGVRMAPRVGFVLDTLAYVLCQRDNTAEANDVYKQSCDAGYKDNCGLQCKKNRTVAAKQVDTSTVASTGRRGRVVRRANVGGSKIKVRGLTSRRGKITNRRGSVTNRRGSGPIKVKVN